MPYKAFDRSVLKYGAPNWASTFSKTNRNHLQTQQNIFLRTITGCVKNDISLSLRVWNFSLALFTCSPKLSILSKVTPSALILDLTGIGEFLIVRCGSNLASLLQVVNTVAFVSSSENSSFLDSNQSCNIGQLSCRVYFQPIGEIYLKLDLMFVFGG